MTERSIILAWIPFRGDAFQARAFVLRMASIFGAATLRASIPIAVFALSYFAAALVSGAGQ
jgi:hypothetical protein